MSDFPITREMALDLAQEYWRLITTEEAESERHFMAAFPSFRSRGYLDRTLFLRLWNWKNRDKRQRHHAEANSEDGVVSATHAAFCAPSDGGALRALMSRRSGGSGLSGVGLRTASAFLHWMRPDTFPMVDVRVFEVLGLPPEFTFRSYSEAADQLRAQDRIWGIGLRDLDRALWSLHKLR